MPLVAEVGVWGPRCLRLRAAGAPTRATPSIQGLLQNDGCGLVVSRQRVAIHEEQVKQIMVKSTSCVNQR
jgi:hypothetical protein